MRPDRLEPDPPGVGSDSRPATRLGIALATVLLLGAALRFGRIEAGLPAVFLPDEELVTKNALSLAARRTLEPLYFEYPTFEIYLLAALYAALFLAGLLAGAYRSATDFAVQFFIDPTPVYLVGRAASAAMSVGAIAVVYVLGRRLYGPRAGLLGALLLALGIEPAREAALATPNAPLAFLAVLALLSIEAVARRGAPRDYLLAGAAIGLSVSAKYNSALLVLPLVVAHVAGSSPRAAPSPHVAAHPAAPGRRPLRPLLVALLAAGGVFLLITPYWILGFADYLDGYLYASSMMRTGHVGYMGKPTILWAVREILAEERTAGLLAFAGGLAALRRRGRGDLLLLSFLVPSFLAIASLKNQQLDYLTCLWPPAAVLAGRALDGVLGLAPLRRSVALAAVVGAALVAPSGLGAAAELRRARGPDTREAARAWIEKNIAPGTGIAFDVYHYGPRLLDAGRAGRSRVGREVVGTGFAAALEEALRGRATYRLVPIIVSTERPTLTGDVADSASGGPAHERVLRDQFLWRQFRSRSRGVDELLAEGAAFIVLSSAWTERFVHGAPPPPDNPLHLLWARERAYFETLLRDPRVVEHRRWDPAGGLVGPRITLYRIDGAR